jgi:hypothetical protein
MSEQELDRYWRKRAERETVLSGIVSAFACLICVAVFLGA